MEPLIVLSYIAIVLMAGVLCAFLSRELRIPYTIILVLLGLFLGSLVQGGQPILAIHNNFILGVGLLALILLVFDSSSRLKVKENEPDALPAMQLINIFTLLSFLIVGLFTAIFFFAEITLEGILYSLIFAVLVVETDIGSVMLLFKDFARARAKHLLYFFETEANLNTAFVVVLPFIILSLIGNANFASHSLLSIVGVNLPNFLYELLVGVGIGFVVGLILLRLVRGWYDENFTPIALVAACLVAYVFTGLLDGNGIVAVAVMGFLYGNVYVAGKEQLNEFSRMLHSSLEIIIFVLLGMVISIRFTPVFILQTLALFAVVLLVRLLSVFIALQKEPFTLREKTFIGLNMPKGIALAVVLLVMSTFGIPMLDTVLELAFMMMLYSIALSFVLDFFAKRILAEEVRLASSEHGVNVLELNIPHSAEIVDRSIPKKAPRRKKKASPKKKKVAKKKASKKPARKKQVRKKSRRR
jgi:potassium/hydrogen antiporter